MSTKNASPSSSVGLSISFDLPEKVSAKLEEEKLAISGPLGKVTQDFSKIPVGLKVEGRKIEITTPDARRRDHAIINTARSHLNNAVQGVTNGYEYRLKVIFAHFPVSVKVQGNQVLVENFYGERSPRVADIVGDTKVEVKGEDIIVRGPSIRDVGQTSANLEQATTVKRKDQRVFLDGVYIYERIRNSKNAGTTTTSAKGSGK